MNYAEQMKAELRAWVQAQCKRVESPLIENHTAILEQGLVSSLQLMDLILFIEERSGGGVDIESLKPGAFRDIDTIFARFYRSGIDE
jgi:acyl carrier protein